MEDMSETDIQVIVIVYLLGAIGVLQGAELLQGAEVLQGTGAAEAGADPVVQLATVDRQQAGVVEADHTVTRQSPTGPSWKPLFVTNLPGILPLGAGALQQWV